jgi:hypothetical protein
MPNTCSGGKGAHVIFGPHKSVAGRARTRAEAAHRDVPNTGIHEHSRRGACPERQRRRKADHVRKGAISGRSVELQIKWGVS